MRLLPAPAARQVATRLVALTLALAGAAACSAAGEDVRTPAPAPAGAVGAAAASSPAAELQAGLTALLVERTYLVAAATDAVEAARGDTEAPAARAALSGLGAGSVALADVLGATYSEAREPLLEALRREDRLLAEHAEVLAAGDADAAATVREELAASQDALARTVRRVVPGLDASAVATRLGSDVQAQLPPRSYERLREVAADSAGSARLLASGIAADRDLGSPGTAAARLRADVTGLLTEHAALVAAQARELRTPGPRAASARAALRANADALAAVLGEAYPAAQPPFLRSWTAHLDRLERYTADRAAGRPGDAGIVRGYPAELARLLAGSVRGLPAESARTELESALTAQLAAVDAAATAAPQAPEALRQATAAVLPAAALLSAAVAEDLRLA
jgi:hypothetical protein